MQKQLDYENVIHSLKDGDLVKVVIGADGKNYLQFIHYNLCVAVSMSGKSTHKILSELVRKRLKLQITKTQAKVILEMMEGRELVSAGKVVEVFRRAGRFKGAIVVLLNPNTGVVAKISKKGVKVCQGSPCTFLLSGNAQPLPEPEMEVDPKQVLEEFRELTSLSNSQFRLFLLLILCSYSPRGPYFVGVILGASGTAKSMLAKMFKMLTDPEKTLTRNLPAHARDLYAAAMNAHVIAYDNISALPPKISDAICSTSSGGGLSRSFGRDEEEVFWASRVFILSGIDNFAVRDDLLQRSILLRTQAIQTPRRMQEHEILLRFKKLRPRLLGVIFSALSHCLAHIKEVNLAGKLPRMADMVEWSVAAGGYLRWPEHKIIEALENNQYEALREYAEVDHFVSAIVALVSERGTVECSPTDLFAQLSEVKKCMSKSLGITINGFPSSPSALGSRLRRSFASLKLFGITFSTSTKHDGRLICLKSIEELQ